MEANIEEDLTVKIKDRVMVNVFMKVENFYIRDNGSKIKWMVWEKGSGLMANNMKVPGKIIKEMEKEKIFTMMEINTKENL